MRANLIPDHEAAFEQMQLDSAGRRHKFIRKAIDITGSGEYFYFTEVVPEQSPTSYFYDVQHPKDQICLHFTMGYLKGDIATLTKPDYHVSVPWVLGRNGITYNLFPSWCWSYHLGSGAVGGNQVRSQRSIGIEISNIGPLRLDGGELLTAYSEGGRRDVYCSAAETEYYLKAPYRGWDHYATFTDAQYQSLIGLLKYLTSRYDIPRQFLPPGERHETTSSTPGFRGIVSHVNYRKDKTDIGPGFDWDRVIAGLG